jgi:23S rRNA G2069 N7-methylase RlmK/C1962 C5-methylase RlmI
LDPPKLAPTRNSPAKATHHYRKLNALAMQLVKPGGLLMTCSCSGAMTQSKSFKDVVAEAAAEVGRSATILRSAGAAPDHTISLAFPEGGYLTILVVCVH